MRYLIRLGVAALAILCLGCVLLMVVTQSTALEGILYEDLTCAELSGGWAFNKSVLSDMMYYYDGCVDFADSPASVGSNDMLACKFIREHATFVEGIVNDLAAVYNIKCVVK